ncbi:rRNA maturation RNase YbeY [Buchnera aphidicola]|uniref:rRNA maturation RNase YbeY n=1 Tax=Buchnera aphidicola TaxID=9 RepID=UPI003463CC80
MSNLNFTYRQCNFPTNILSFQYNQVIKKNHILLGDLILCKNVIEQEAIKYKKNIYSRWAHMIIHGTLHLLGYDHKEKNEKLQMESIENKIMLYFNYPLPYVLNNN